MKTIEGYEVIKVSEYRVNTSIYMNHGYSDKVYENGLSGVVKDPNLDDRFVCHKFCIWNSKGVCVYISGRGWGRFEKYKIQTE